MSKNNNEWKNVAGLDHYLNALSERDYNKLIGRIQPQIMPGPLLSMDLFTSRYHHSLEIQRRTADLNNILMLDIDNSWNFDTELLLQKNYDALIVTDGSQKIKWVNKGFSKMTGYPAVYAIGKTPRFLQGEETVFESRKRIKEKLEKTEVFTETVINYRKNGEIYKCEITVIPLINKRLNSIHFLAIEKEVA